MKPPTKVKSSGMRKHLTDTTNRMKHNRETPKLKLHNHEFAKQVVSQPEQTSAEAPSTHSPYLQQSSYQSGDFDQMEQDEESSTRPDVEMTEEPATLVEQKQNHQQEGVVAASSFQLTKEPPTPLASYTQAQPSGGPVQHAKKGGRKAFDPLASGGRNSRSNNLMDEARVDVSNGIELSLAEFETAPTVVAGDFLQSHQDPPEDSGSPEVILSSPESLEVSTNTSISEDAAEVGDHIQAVAETTSSTNIVAIEEVSHVSNITQCLTSPPPIVEVSDPWNPIWAASQIHSGLFKPVWTDKQAPGLDTTLSNQARVELFKVNQGDNHDRVLRDATLQESDQWIEEYECIWVVILLGWPSWKFLTVDEREMAEVVAGDDEDDKSWAPDLNKKSHDDRLKIFLARKRRGNLQGCTRHAP